MLGVVAYLLHHTRVQAKSIGENAAAIAGAGNALTCMAAHRGLCVGPLGAAIAGGVGGGSGATIGF
jgi:hypothetical protein